MESQKVIKKLNNQEEEKLQEEAYMQQQYEEELQWQAELDRIREENYDFEYGDYRY